MSRKENTARMETENKNRLSADIMTFHFPYNCGAVLQCYALQTVLEKKGCRVQVIDYVPWYHVNRYVPFKNPVAFADEWSAHVPPTPKACQVGQRVDSRLYFLSAFSTEAAKTKGVAQFCKPPFAFDGQIQNGCTTRAKPAAGRSVHCRERPALEHSHY